MGAIVNPNAGVTETTDRLKDLRQLMNKNQIDTYVVPTDDAHASEYVADCDKRRDFISGFTGSAGTAVITIEEAFLFTDGRYFNQAGQQLDVNWALKKTGLVDQLTWQKFVTEKMPEGRRVGVDPTLVAFTDAEDIDSKLALKKSSLIPITPNLIDQIWSTRPTRPTNKIITLSESYSGLSFTSKITSLRTQIKSLDPNAVAYFAPLLDEIAWLFNLRGSDIDYNPVFFGNALIPIKEDSKPILFVDPKQVDDEVKKHLGSEVVLEPYEATKEVLERFSGQLKASDIVLMPPATSMALADAIGNKNRKKVDSPIYNAKAKKNETELKGFKECHLRDGAALVAYFAWLEEQLLGGAKLSEFQAASKLEEFRTQQKHFKGLSFPTISSTGPNAAIIHYSPDPENSAIIDKDQIYLCDSGAQFLDGTTDVTRTWHFTKPSEEERRAFTRVLQGHIAIDTVVFPYGTTGYVLDPMARRPLWADGLDYRHGTGHGVGSYLNVHEGPAGIGFRLRFNDFKLEEGMVLSNEPGFYKDGKWGIRLESLVTIKKANPPNNFGDQTWLKFEHITMCPIHTKLIDTSLLLPPEREWVNKYHQEVRENLTPLLKEMGDERALKWLQKETEKI